LLQIFWKLIFNEKGNGVSNDSWGASPVFILAQETKDFKIA
jgi:hypothetical protein